MEDITSCCLFIFVCFANFTRTKITTTLWFFDHGQQCVAPQSKLHPGFSEGKEFDGAVASGQFPASKDVVGVFHLI